MPKNLKIDCGWRERVICVDISMRANWEIVCARFIRFNRTVDTICSPRGPAVELVVFFVPRRPPLPLPPATTTPTLSLSPTIAMSDTWVFEKMIF